MLTFIKNLMFGAVPSTSEAKKFHINDLFKTLRTAAMGAVGVAVLAFLAEMGKVDFGAYTAIATVVVTTLSDLVRRYMQENKGE